MFTSFRLRPQTLTCNYLLFTAALFRSSSSLATTTTTTTTTTTINPNNHNNNTMTWAETWESILSGGPGLWKVDDLAVKQQALQRICEYSNVNADSDNDQKSLKILCPLAGDDPFVQQAWQAGHDVTAIDLVPAAVAAMRRQFGGNVDQDWTLSPNDDDNNNDHDDGTQVWKHKSGRATLYVGDMMQERPELHQQFDAVYDKDSFGALALDLRAAYCQRLSEYCQPGAVLYAEVKNKPSSSRSSSSGPPHHVEKQDLMQASSFGTHFEHVIALGQVYSLAGRIPPGSDWTQMGYILRRK